MENGFSTSDAILTQAMSGGFGNRGNSGSEWGGGGYGYHTGNQVLAAEAHANGTATKEAIDCNAVRMSDGITTVAQQFENGARQEQINSVNKNITDLEFRNTDRFTALNKDITDVEFRSLDRQRDIERSITDAAKEAAKCCCEAQLLAVQNQAKTDASIATILANQVCDTRVSDAVANAAQNAKLDILLSERGRHHG